MRRTFSKRRAALLKQSHEISVSCGADVALIIFSTTGKLYEYSTDFRMGKILERYERYCSTETESMTNKFDSQEDLGYEYEKLKCKFKALQRKESHFMGENLDTLSLEELRQLEIEVGASLKHTRFQKNQLLLDSIAELQRKENLLQEHRTVLEKIVGSENDKPEEQN